MTITPDAPSVPARSMAPWFLTVHALQRMQEMDVSRRHVIGAIEAPTLSYPSPRIYGPDRRIRVGDGLAVVVNEFERKVITVLWAGREGRTPSEEGADPITSR